VSPVIVFFCFRGAKSARFGGSKAESSAGVAEDPSNLLQVMLAKGLQNFLWDRFFKRQQEKGNL
jgi:hypothetical protein